MLKYFRMPHLRQLTLSINRQKLTNKGKSFSVSPVGLVCLFVILLLVTVNFIFYSSGAISELQHLEYMKIILVLESVLLAYIFTIVPEGILNPYNLFLFNFVLFLVSRAAIDLIGLGDFGEDATFSVASFSIATQLETLFQLITSLFGFLLGFLLAFRLDHRSMSYVSENATSLIIRNQRLFFAISIGLFFVVIAFKYEVLMFVMTEGYIALQSGEFGSKPFSVFLAEGFFWFFSLSLLSISNSKGIKRGCLVFIMAILLVDLASGYRGKSMALILILLWFAEFRGAIKFSIPKLGIGIFTLIWVMILINEVRAGRDMFRFDSDLYILVFSIFFWVQGFSVHVISYSNAYINELSADFSVSNLFAIITMQLDKLGNALFGSKVMDLNYMLDNHGYSNYLLSNAVNSSNFNSGFTMGTSFIAEFNMIGGWVAVLIGTFILGFFFTLAYERFKRSAFGVALILIIYPELIYIPRNTFFLFLNNNLIELFCLALLLGLLWLVKTKKQWSN